MARAIPADQMMLHVRVPAETNDWLRKIAEQTNLSIVQVAAIFLMEAARRNLSLSLTSEGWQ